MSVKSTEAFEKYTCDLIDLYKKHMKEINAQHKNCLDMAIDDLNKSESLTDKEVNSDD